MRSNVCKLQRQNCYRLTWCRYSCTWCIITILLLSRQSCAIITTPHWRRVITLPASYSTPGSTCFRTIRPRLPGAPVSIRCKNNFMNLQSYKLNNLYIYIYIGTPETKMHVIPYVLRPWGHSKWLQLLSVSSSTPIQSSPIFDGGGLLHSLLRLLVPPPQVTEHAVQCNQ